MRSALVMGVLSCWALLGCESSPEPTTSALTLRYLDSCALGAPARLTLTATGDFLPESRDLSPDTPVTIDDFPTDLRWLKLEARAGSERAVGLLRSRPASETRDVLMLPLEQSCPLGDPLAALPAGGALAALDDGALLIVGGREAEGAARSAAVRLSAGARLVEQVEGGTLLRRAAASATVSGLYVVVAGGAPDERGPAHDTYEVYDQLTARFEPALSAKLALGPRRDHAAVVLPDGGVLLVGGRAEVGAGAIADAERIDAVAGRAERAGTLEVARVAPALHRLDDGQILVVGGTDADGRAVGLVERYLPDAGRFESLSEVTVDDALVSAPLPGARLAVIACADDPEAAQASAACRVTLVLAAGETPVIQELSLRATDAAAEAFFPESGTPQPLREVRVAALDDGQVLLTARATARVSQERVALLLDLSRAEARVTDASRVPAALGLLADATLVELDENGASLRRVSSRTPFDQPPADPLGDGRFVLDAPARFASSSGPVLEAAVDGARFDLPPLRYARARISIALSGEGALLLLPEAAPARRVVLGDDEVAFEGCRLGARGEGTLELVWEAPELRLASGDARCRVGAASRHVGFALELSSGARVEGLQIERL